MKKREYISKKYKSFLSSLIKEKLIKFLPESKENYSSNHLFILNINFKKIKKTKDNFFNFMLKHKIYCQYHYIPIYNFENFRYLKKNMVNTKSYFANSVSLPIYFELSIIGNKKNYKNFYSNFLKKMKLKITKKNFFLMIQNHQLVLQKYLETIMEKKSLFLKHILAAKKVSVVN